MFTTRRTASPSRALERLAYVLLWAVLAALLLGGAALWAYQAWSRDRIHPGVHVLGVHVGGLRPAAALERLRAAITADDLPYVTLYSQEQEWLLSTAALGGSLRLEDAVWRAWALGRSGVFRRDLATQARLVWFGYEVVPEFEMERGLALIGLRRIARQAGHPARAAQLWVAGLQARTDSSSVGWDLNVVAIREAIVAAVNADLGASHWLGEPRLRLLWQNRPVVAAGPPEPVRVPLLFQEVVPPLTEVEGASEGINAILSAPVRLHATFQAFDAGGAPHAIERRWLIDQSTLSTWLTLRKETTDEGSRMAVDLDRERVADYVGELAESISRLPIEPRFGYDPASATLTTRVPGQVGYSLHVDDAVEMIVRAARGEGSRDVELPLAALAPRVTRADLEALLPLSLISVGESNFSGSTAERAQNIRTATARFDGVVVPPGRTFSFLEHLGPVTVAEGYSQSYIIYGDRTVLGPGGGVCQVSTTAFRAAFWGGYPIVERWAHSYRVTTYEPPLGLDAAVFSPGTDFRFRNDTDAPILILTEVDDANGALYFRFYGAPPERKVRMEGPFTARPVSAGEPVVVEDPSLAPGARVMDERARDGLDVTVNRVVERDGAVVSRDEVFSRYVPWPARYRVGPTPAQ